jgi:ABC-type uncharacterized transport system permease subunit
MSATPPLFAVTLACYSVSCALYLTYLIAGSSADGIARAARFALAATFAAQAVDIGWLCVHGQHPAVSAREAMSFAAWLICGAYLIVSLRSRVPVIGALVVPVSLVLDVAARLAPSHEAAHGVSTLGAVHIVLATAGIALFAVAAGGAVIYLIEERNLKGHKTGRFLRRGPALETLDRLNRRCIVFGFPLFTIAVITGAVWGIRLHNSLFTPQYSIAVAAWLMYAVLLVARMTAGWRGRRAAIMTLGGFFTSLSVLLFYFVRGIGGPLG